MQFYPADWLSNPNLRRCSPAARGVWMDVLCVLHDADEYGLVRWPLKEVAQAVGAQLSHLRELVQKGVLKGSDSEVSEPFIYTPRSGRRDGVSVTLIPTQPGPIWYSSRMVRDEHVRTQRAAGGGIAAPPEAQPEGTPKPAPKPPIGEPLDVHPSRARPSSSSSSSSSDTPIGVSSDLGADLLGATAHQGNRAAKSAGRGARLPKTAVLTDDWRAYAKSKGFTDSQIEVEFEKFANYWWSCAGQKGVKQDWDATWRNWIMNSISRNGGNARNQQGKQQGGFRNGFAQILNESIAGRNREPDDLEIG